MTEAEYKTAVRKQTNSAKEGDGRLTKPDPRYEQWLPL
jgi:hypothetical protein